MCGMPILEATASVKTTMTSSVPSRYVSSGGHSAGLPTAIHACARRVLSRIARGLIRGRQTKRYRH